MSSLKLRLTPSLDRVSHLDVGKSSLSWAVGELFVIY